MRQNMMSEKLNIMLDAVIGLLHATKWNGRLGRFRWASQAKCMIRAASCWHCNLKIFRI